MHKFWIKRDQLDVTSFIISLFNAQHVSDVNTSILRSLRLICWVISWVVLLWFDVCWCYVMVWLGWCGIRMRASTPPQPNHNVTPIHIEPEQHNPWNNWINNRKLLRMNVLISETCWALNNVIIKKWHQVGPSFCNYQNDVRSNKHKMQKFLFYKKFVVSLYMFPTLLCSSSGGQMILYSIWYRHTEDHLFQCEDTRCCVIKFDLLMMSTTVL